MQVTIDHDDLLARLPGTDLGTGMPISGEAIPRLCCDAGISRLVTKGTSLVLDKGPTVRLATSSQRRALLDRYGGCAGCGAHTRCHHRLHEGGWTLTPASNGDGWDWIDPQGKRHRPHTRRRTPPHPGPPPTTHPPTDEPRRRAGGPVNPPSLFDN